MQQSIPSFRLLAGAACLAWAALLTAPAAAAPATKGRAPKSSRVVWKSRPPQLISLTTGGQEYAGAEARLAQFIRALYAGQRARAAAMLSSKATRADRQALIEKRWLRESTRNRKEFTQALFMKDLQIRTQGFYQDSADCYVIPRKPAPKKSARFTGYLKVRMVKENGEWRVDMRPGKV